MSYESYSIYMFASDVEENVQTVNVNCDCSKKLDAIHKEVCLTNRLLMENRQMMLEVMQGFLEPASVFASLDSASESASAAGQNPQIST